ncbi:MAG: acetyl-CoA carboxylase biotin carboxyl carrier protein subunit [Ectothiorhodospiraceae bacterium]|nr:acetyl-CoA carboxylase biotin carboxyl carrier protein subunit [Ectothiorhodospiraceae bacterium]
MSNPEEYTTLIIDDATYQTKYTKKYERRKKYAAANPDHILAYIPGVIQEINVKVGDTVKWGDKLLVLEAMKMRNDVVAPKDGVVKAIKVKTGQMVPKNHLLIELH